MVITVYVIMQFYFLLGALLAIYISRKKDISNRKSNYTKFAFYYLIVNVMILGTIIHGAIFQALTIIIVVISGSELITVFVHHGSRQKSGFFVYSVLVFFIVSTGFILFSFLSREVIVYTYFLVMTSEASAQQSGQLFGERNIFKKLSPNKTLEGVIGSFIITLITSVIIHDLVGVTITLSIALGFAISILSITGDLAASYYKRYFGIKDFSKIIPGHGGVLDRFDSLLFVAPFVFIFFSFINSN